MSERIVFLDIDGPVIPFSMFLVDRHASINRVLAPIPVAVVKMICERSGARVVFKKNHKVKFTLFFCKKEEAKIKYRFKSE
jgi:hypothetical protein